MFYKNFDATMQKCLVSHYQNTAHTSLIECLPGAALLRSSANLDFGPINDDF